MAEKNNNVSTNDWGLERDHFAGWIPCVSGHLSFSRFGVDDDCATANLQINPPHRKIFIAQRRYVNDYALPSWFLVHICRWENPVKDFYLTASTLRAEHPEGRSSKGNVDCHSDTVGRLQGEVAVVRHQKDGKLNKLRKQTFKKLSFLAEKNHKLNQEKQIIQDKEDIFNNYSKSINDLNSSGVLVELYKFVIFRTGEIRLNIIESSLGERSFKGDSDASKEDYVSSMAPQVFYFLKDIAHRHYHHHNHQDNILPLLPVTPDDDESWRRETMWSLVRAVLDERRGSTLDSFARAEGILAYAAAFQEHLGGHKRNLTGSPEFKPIKNTSEYDLSFMKASLVARRDQIRDRFDYRAQLFHSLVGTLIAIVALWIASANLQSSEATTQSNLQSIIYWFRDYPDLVVVFSIGAIFVYLSWARGRKPVPSLVWWPFKVIDHLSFTAAQWLTKNYGNIGDRIAAVATTGLYYVLAAALVAVTLELQGISVWDTARDAGSWVFQWIAGLFPSAPPTVK